ncbi:MAG: hypothetical protein K2H50_06645 [Paramuribaculum sp.]|nr:hypothetical protein [Paramuribaculum sp.]MDE5836667.1 hypothetical protein [Paramuribaculum sp.]
MISDFFRILRFFRQWRSPAHILARHRLYSYGADARRTGYRNFSELSDSSDEIIGGQMKNSLAGKRSRSCEAI